jgi:hypothetical protein
MAKRKGRRKEVRLVNLSLRPCYVPTRSGDLRLGPKAAEQIAASEVTEATRQTAADGRIQIRTCE